MNDYSQLCQRAETLHNPMHSTFQSCFLFTHLRPAVFLGLHHSRIQTKLEREKAAKAAEAEAHVRLRSLVDGSARVLSASWLSIVWRTTAKSPATGGGGGGGGFSSDAQHADVSVDATVPVIVVRRLMQTCGMLRSGAGGPTLAHVDMEIQLNTVGKGRLGHREVWPTCKKRDGRGYRV